MKNALRLLSLGLLAGCQTGTQYLEQSPSDPAPGAACCSTAPLAEDACLAPEECADEAETCPPGPDCFAPEICADEEMSCPAQTCGE